MNIPELIERLQSVTLSDLYADEDAPIIKEAIDTLESLQARVKELEEYEWMYRELCDE